MEEDFWWPWHPLIPEPAPWDAGRSSRIVTQPHMSWFPSCTAKPALLMFCLPWGPSGSSWKSKGKNKISGWLRRGAASWLGGTGGIWGAERRGTHFRRAQGSSMRFLSPKFSQQRSLGALQMLELRGGRTGLFPLSFLLRFSSSPLLSHWVGNGTCSSPFGLGWEWEAAQLSLITMDRRLPDLGSHFRFLPIDAEDKTLHEKLFHAWSHPNQVTTSKASPGMSSLPLSLSWGGTCGLGMAVLGSGVISVGMVTLGDLSCPDFLTSLNLVQVSPRSFHHPEVALDMDQPSGSAQGLP